ncbi:hypothetical protein ASG20_06390 [Sphingomonas sp. Leaf198]|nr:hypothetical protein ASG20_06390 [Sphingomonas sp. Leaf198]
MPTAVVDLAVRLGVQPAAHPPCVSLTQAGHMKRTLESDSWMAFKASQTIATDRCAFDWRAKVGPFGLISGRDALEDGDGRFDITALGVIPLARAQHTPALVRGELMRYLAEIAWAPHAILHNPELRWRVDGPDSLSVSAGVGATASEVILGLDSDGRIATAFAPDRPRSATPPILPTPWHGRFSDYRLVDTIWVPTVAEVAWSLPAKDVAYWRCRVASWNADGVETAREQSKRNRMTGPS